VLSLPLPLLLLLLSGEEEEEEEEEGKMLERQKLLLSRKDIDLEVGRKKRR
jgi:hypothetical protein